MNIRVTQNAVSRQYNKNMNSTLSQMNKLNNQVISGRKFLRSYENPIAAAKAINIRKGLSNLDTYEEALKSADGLFSSAEGSLKTVSSEISTVTTKLVYGVTGTRTEDDRKAIATEIEGVANSMIADMNLEYADRKVFGGTNNSTQAFAYNSTTGVVTFNGDAVNTSSSIAGSNGKYYASRQDVTATTITNATDVTTLAALPKVYYVDSSQVSGTAGAFKMGSPLTDITADLESGHIVRSTLVTEDGKTYYNNPDVSKSTITGTTTQAQYTALLSSSTPPTKESPMYIAAGDVDATTHITTAGVDISAEITAGTIVVSNKLVSTSDGKVYNNLTEITQAQAESANCKRFKDTNSILIDVGIGIKYDKDGVVDPASALDISLNGAELLGCGTDADGDSKNVIQLAFDAAKALRAGDISKATKLIDKVKASQTTLLVGTTSLGVKEKSIEYSLAKIETDRVDLSAAQTKTEGMTMEAQTAALTDYKVVQSAYNATLQMGSKVVPMSLFDFIN